MLRREGADKSFVKTLMCTKSTDEVTHLALSAFDLLVEVLRDTVRMQGLRLNRVPCCD